MGNKNSSKNYSYHSPEDVKWSDRDDDEGCCSGCVGCLKIFLHFFNFFLFIAGIAITVLGVWKLDLKHSALVVILSTGYYDALAYALIGLGGLAIFITLLGCCGLFKSSSKVMLVYSVLLGLVLFFEAICGISAYIYKAQIGEEISANLNEQFNAKYGFNNETTAAVDEMQIDLKCCGVHSFEDWKVSKWHESKAFRRNNKVPDSCCINPEKSCGKRDHPSNIRYSGCYDRLIILAGDNLNVIGGSALVICLIHFLATILSCHLYYKLRIQDQSISV